MNNRRSTDVRPGNFGMVRSPKGRTVMRIEGFIATGDTKQQCVDAWLLARINKVQSDEANPRVITCQNGEYFAL